MGRKPRFKKIGRSSLIGELTSFGTQEKVKYSQLLRMVKHVENTQQVEIIMDLIGKSRSNGVITANQEARLLSSLFEHSKKFRDKEYSMKIGPAEIGFKEKRL